MTGATGTEFITTVVVAATDEQLFTVTMTLYVPASVSAAEAIVGF